MQKKLKKKIIKKLQITPPPSPALPSSWTISSWIEYQPRLEDYLNKKNYSYFTVTFSFTIYPIRLKFLWIPPSYLLTERKKSFLDFQFHWFDHLV